MDEYGQAFSDWYTLNYRRFNPEKGRSAAFTTTAYIREAMAAYDKEVLRMPRGEWRKKWHKSKLKPTQQP
jgi:hypothetical protein